MNDKRKSRLFDNDKIIALIFMALTVIFIVASMTNQAFFDWVYDRHHHPWSWYIRPLFIIPFCFFAYRHSWSGMSITLFCIFTSMFWFSRPEVVPDNVQSFLAFEKAWLYGDWTYQKILLILTVPLSFLALGLAFWKRSLWIGLAVVVLMATGKIIWSVQHAGEAGKSILTPAVVGLGICIVLIYYGFKRLERKRTSEH
ncbi:MAG TPA: hypothetical protein VK014_02980 [Cyclobacteriaceae bacterium]|nr:hypothetical protein [Cyclobacteriaceae bacterium]